MTDQTLTATRYRYDTGVSFGGDEPTAEFDVTVSYTVTWGRPETPPAYDHGGLPADPDEVDDIRLELIDGKPRPWDLGCGFLSDDEVAEMVVDQLSSRDAILAAMIEEAAQTEAAWAE